MRNKLSEVLPLICALGANQALAAQIARFQHIVIVVQENRTPDNLFRGLCIPASVCSSEPANSQYNIQMSHWLDKQQKGGTIEPLPVDLDAGYDLGHGHYDFIVQCDFDPAAGRCLMDGPVSGTACSGKCPSQPVFRYVDNSTGIVDPYLTMATQYGWANYMFQTNQGPSFPAHQFLFGATSAPSAADDAAAIFAAENPAHVNTGAGCNARAAATVEEIFPPGNETQSIYPCFEHDTLPDVLTSVWWRYYAPGPGTIWTAPNAIKHICQPNQARGGECAGPEWRKNVDLVSADVLKDIGSCLLPDLTWVIPTGQNSDHPDANRGGGPSWVASIVNAIGASKCTNADGSTYWDSTAILVTWDDWGGWYDHEPPTILEQPQGDYQYGFRVPFLFISAYTPAGFIDNGRHDFGSIIRFAEHNFGGEEGVLGFADARAHDDLSTFFNLTLTPRPFLTIPAPLPAEYFLNDHAPQTAPDDDDSPQ